MGQFLLRGSKDGPVDTRRHFQSVLHLLTRHVYLTDLSSSLQPRASLVHKAIRQTIHSLDTEISAFPRWQLKRTILTLTYMAMGTAS
jgi:hypothetical protein